MLYEKYIKDHGDTMTNCSVSCYLSLGDRTGSNYFQLFRPLFYRDGRRYSGLSWQLWRFSGLLIVSYLRWQFGSFEVQS